MGQTVDILSLGNCELNAWLQARSSFVEKTDTLWIFQQFTDFDEMTNLPENLRSCKARFTSRRRVLAISESSDGSAAKLLIALEDGQKIETMQCCTDTGTPYVSRLRSAARWDVRSALQAPAGS